MAKIIRSFFHSWHIACISYSECQKLPVGGLRMATSTPWGMSDYCEKVTRGISFLGTPSHGGYRVSKKMYEKRIAEKGLAHGEITADYGNYLWFEEDCQWSFVVAAFPEFFSEKNQKAAKETIDYWYPKYFENGDIRTRRQLGMMDN